MKTCVALFVVSLASLGSSQDTGEFKKPTTKAVKTSSGPVTKAEARKVLDRAWVVMAKGLKMSMPSPTKLVAGPQAVTKNEILAEFALIANASAKHFKRSPRPSNFDASRLRKDADSSQLNYLVSKGLVMPLGPLVTGKNGTVSTSEFGDAVGVLIARLADLCHLPSTKYSPNLMPG